MFSYVATLVMPIEVPPEIMKNNEGELMKYPLTGISGFVGAHIVDRLLPRVYFSDLFRKQGCLAFVYFFILSLNFMSV